MYIDLYRSMLSAENAFIYHELSPGQKQRRFGQEHACKWLVDKGISTISVVSLSHLYYYRFYVNLS